MKKVLKWIGIFISTVGLGMLMLYSIPVLLTALIVAGLEAERAAMDDAAEAVLNQYGLADYVEYAPWHDLSIDGVFTAFEMPKYDYHTNNNDLHERMLSRMTELPWWQIKAVTAEEYAALLHAHWPEAAFLFPMDVTFDALIWSGNELTLFELALFDQETGLMIELRTDRQPHPGTLSLHGLSIPHNGYVYETETHGGFHGDGVSYRACIVPEEDRAAFVATLSAHADWQEGTVTRDEYITLQEHSFAFPPLYPLAGVDFDWWCWVDTYARNHPENEKGRNWNNNYFPAVMRDNGACHSMNWYAAWYDEDSGLFVYFEYDS